MCFAPERGEQVFGETMMTHLNTFITAEKRRFFRSTGGVFPTFWLNKSDFKIEKWRKNECHIYFGD